MAELFWPVPAQPVRPAQALPVRRRALRLARPVQQRALLARW
jgi:hypothetical protein